MSIPGEAPGAEKRGRASLIGGSAIGLAVLALWLLITREVGVASTFGDFVGVLVGAGIAAWIRGADL